MTDKLTEEEQQILDQHWDKFCKLQESLKSHPSVKMPMYDANDNPIVYKSPQLKNFIKKHTKKGWTYCEQYMFINGKKVEERMPLGKKFQHGSYRNGMVLIKETDKIIFITYTLLDGRCVMNHESLHDLECNILDLTVNAFYSGMIYGVDAGAKDYLKELIEAYDKRDLKWDIME